MRDAAYETQVLDVRRETHAAVADALAARGAEPALIAAHLAFAGAAERAVALYLEAARSEQRRGAHLETVMLVSRALELAGGPAGVGRPRAHRALRRMARGPSLSSLARGGHADNVVPDLIEAVRLATERGARVSRLRAAVDLARLPARSRPEGWRSLLAEARDDMPRSTTTVDTAAAGELLDR
jgi:hypothetical protein